METIFRKMPVANGLPLKNGKYSFINKNGNLFEQNFETNNISLCEYLKRNFEFWIEEIEDDKFEFVKWVHYNNYVRSSVDGYWYDDSHWDNPNTTEQLYQLFLSRKGKS